MNGFSDKEMQHPNVITHIELVLEELNSINGISLFRNLKSLTLINVGLKKIEVKEKKWKGKEKKRNEKGRGVLVEME